MKLISETLEDVQFLKEEDEKGKTYKIKGIFMQGDIKNRNGRVYPVEVLKNEVDNYKKICNGKNKGLALLDPFSYCFALLPEKNVLSIDLRACFFC